MQVSVASLLVAMLSLGFGFVQFTRHPEVDQSAVTSTTIDDQTLAAASLIAPSGASSAAEVGASLPTNSRRDIQHAVRVLEPNYTIQSGDTLNGIAAQFHTTAERIQAWNDLSNPRALRVGTKLVIPPAF